MKKMCPFRSFAAAVRFSLVFTSEKSDFDELLFILGGEIHSPIGLPVIKTGEYYLLKRNAVPVQDIEQENPNCCGNFKDVLSLNGQSETVNLQYLLKKVK